MFRWVELANHKGKWMISEKQLIVASLRTLAIVVWILLGAICKREYTGYESAPSCGIY